MGDKKNKVVARSKFFIGKKTMSFSLTYSANTIVQKEKKSWASTNVHCACANALLLF